MENKTIAWSALLSDAVNKPGIISSAYTVFHNYSVANQLWAWSQCQARDIELSPIATYKSGRHWADRLKRVKRLSLSACP